MINYARTSSALGYMVFSALAALSATASAAVSIDWVSVGNAGNAADTSGYGAVAYEYRIGKYEVTNAQYGQFLNAVASIADTHSLYDSRMASYGITASGTSGSYTYSVTGALANHPVNFVSWYDAARFANWMINGQPTGAQNNASTENGAYTLTTFNDDGNVPNKNAINPNTGIAPDFYIPTESEWYKAAYYSQALNGGAGGYYSFATQSNDFPGNLIGDSANQANYNNGVYSVTQSADYVEGQDYLTDVGSFSGSASYYGTFDQGGNMWEWNDLSGGATSLTRGVRGGNFNDIFFGLTSSRRLTDLATSNIGYGGFRLASVPEPSSWVLTMLFSASLAIRRRR